MKGNPEHTRVLYGNIESQSLQKIANGITQSFVDAGKSVEHYNSFDKKKFNFSMYYLRFGQKRGWCCQTSYDRNECEISKIKKFKNQVF